MPYTFKKEERLCREKTIDELFAMGKSFFSYPYVVHWKITNDADNIPAKLLIVVPKKKLHHAVDRNRTKRLIRECYRLQKNELSDFLSSKGIAIAMAIIYIDKQVPKYQKLYEHHGTAIQRLIKELNKSLNNEDNK